MIEAVLFDLDDTLLDHDGASLAALEAALEREHPGIEGDRHRAAVVEWRRLEELHYRSYLDGEIDVGEQRRRRAGGLLEWLGKPSRPSTDLDAWYEEFLAGYRGHWSLFDDVEPALDGLERAGYALGVITNAEGEAQRLKLAAMGIERRLPLVVASAEVGVAKPDAGIFAAACDRLGCPPERVAYVGDRLETDARGASEAGLRGIWLFREGRDIQGSGTSDIATIATLDELLPLL
ncbi:MAG: HAD family hydrolase [Solirubrobacterales bacterium]